MLSNPRSPILSPLIPIFEFPDIFDSKPESKVFKSFLQQLENSHNFNKISHQQHILEKVKIKMSISFSLIFLGLKNSKIITLRVFWHARSNCFLIYAFLYFIPKKEEKAISEKKWEMESPNIYSLRMDDNWIFFSESDRTRIICLLNIFPKKCKNYGKIQLKRWRMIGIS